MVEGKEKKGGTQNMEGMGGTAGTAMEGTGTFPGAVVVGLGEVDLDADLGAEDVYAKLRMPSY